MQHSVENDAIITDSDLSDNEGTYILTLRMAFKSHRENSLELLTRSHFGGDEAIQ